MTVTGNGTLLWVSGQGVSHFLSLNIPGVRGLAPAAFHQSGALT